MNEYVFFWHADGENGMLGNWYPCSFTKDGITSDLKVKKARKT